MHHPILTVGEARQLLYQFVQDFGMDVPPYNRVEGRGAHTRKASDLWKALEGRPEDDLVWEAQMVILRDLDWWRAGATRLVKTSPTPPAAPSGAP